MNIKTMLNLLVNFTSLNIVSFVFYTKKQLKNFVLSAFFVIFAPT